MAETSLNPITLEAFQLKSDVIAARIFDGVAIGTDIPEPLRNILATLPDINDDSGRWFFSDNIDTDLLTEPEDLDAEDIALIQQKVGAFMASASTPEDLETAALFYLHFKIGNDYILPENTTALEQIQIVSLKERMEYLTGPYAENRTSFIGESVPRYTMDKALATNPASPDFIAALSGSVRQIQRDMRIAAINVPEGSEGDIAALADVGLDLSGAFGTETNTHLQSYFDYLEANPSFGDPQTRARAEQFETLMVFYNDLPEDARLSINAGLDLVAGEAPGIGDPLAEEALAIAAEEARVAAEAEAAVIAAETAQATTAAEAEEASQSPEYKASVAIIENAAALFGVPQEAMNSITSLRAMEALPSAHFHEGFRREMRDILEDSFIEIYGINNPTTSDVADRIRGGEGDQFRFIADANNNAYEFVTMDDGSEQLVRVDQDGTLVAINPENAPVLFEYHLYPDGDIAKYLIGNDGETHSVYPDGQPVMLDAKNPNFDMSHIHFITERFLERRAQHLWDETTNDIDMTNLFPDGALPSSEEINAGIVTTEEKIKEALRQYYVAQEQPLSEGELNALHVSIRGGTKDQFEQRLAPEGDLQTAASNEIYAYLIQLQALENMGEVFAMRDFAGLANSGRLPGGLFTSPIGLTEGWKQDWSDNYDRGVFRWDGATEFRIFTPEIYQAYSDNIASGQPLDASLFQNDPHAMDYMTKMGFVDESGQGTLDYIQASMVARELMVKEAADRRGLDSTNSPEARAAFVEDFRAGMYNWHDVQIFMRSFDADGPHRDAIRAEHDQVAYSQGQFDTAADTRHRAALFNEAFGQDTTISLSSGAALEVKSTTITRDDAVAMFWRDYTERRNFTDPETGEGYTHSQYELGYDEMLALHGDDFAHAIKDIMEDGSLYQQFMLRDVNNPMGHMENLYIRRYQGAMEDRREIEMKRDLEVVAEAAPSRISEATPDPAIDTITPQVLVEEDNTPATTEELRAMCDELTAASAAVLGAHCTPLAPANAPLRP